MKPVSIQKTMALAITLETGVDLDDETSNPGLKRRFEIEADLLKPGAAESFDRDALELLNEVLDFIGDGWFPLDQTTLSFTLTNVMEAADSFPGQTFEFNEVHYGNPSQYGAEKIQEALTAMFHRQLKLLTLLFGALTAAVDNGGLET